MRPTVSRLASTILIFPILTVINLFAVTASSFSILSLPPLSQRTPSLFPKSALITLTDDNSTFFLARPAAFGPELPEDSTGNGDVEGLRGEMEWAGESGELGCEESRRERNLSAIEVPHSDARVYGKIVLLPRGGCGFYEKIMWAQKRGALAVIVGDNVGGRGLVTMYAKGDTSDVTIPSVFTTHTTAQLLISLLPSRNGPTFLPPTHNGQKPPGYATESKEHHEGLWLTLTCTPGPASPFLDTLLVLVVSPLATLGIVYTMLAIRARIQRRRWRAPKSVVESLPVRVYSTQNYASTSTSTPADAVSDRESSQTPINPSVPTSSLECVVCLEDYVPGVSKVMRLPCGHEFHVSCITPWLVTRRRTCPICKGDVVKMVREKNATEPHGEDGTVDAVGSNDLEGATVSDRWRSRAVSMVGGGRGRSIRSLVEHGGLDGRRSNRGSRSQADAVNERTPLLLVGAAQGARPADVVIDE